MLLAAAAGWTQGYRSVVVGGGDDKGLSFRGGRQLSISQPISGGGGGGDGISLDGGRQLSASKLISGGGSGDIGAGGNILSRGGGISGEDVVSGGGDGGGGVVRAVMREEGDAKGMHGGSSGDSSGDSSGNADEENTSSKRANGGRGSGGGLPLEGSRQLSASQPIGGGGGGSSPWMAVGWKWVRHRGQQAARQFASTFLWIRGEDGIGA
jgi:hypothetical protein